jgi:prophage tail gpP-like protein
MAKEDLRENVTLVIGDDADPTTGRIGDYFSYWSNVEIKRSIDTYSSVTFSAPFEPDRKEFRETFRPFTFKRLECLVNLETLVTGFCLNIEPDSDENSSEVQVTGYAKPAVFHTCNIPPDELGKGLQLNGLSLRAIAERIAKPFGIRCDFRDEDATPFKKCKLEIDKKIQDFLVDLVKQRNRVFTDTPAGELLCWQSVGTGSPVAELIEGVNPMGKISAVLSPDECYSEVTGFGKKKRGKKESRWTAHNHWLDAPLRPHTFKLEDAERADVPEATLAKMGRFFAAMARWTIPGLPGWRDPHGELWKPNTTILVTAPRAMIYQPTELLIRDVTLTQTEEADFATLEVVMPGAFSGSIPEQLPWNEIDS